MLYDVMRAHTHTHTHTHTQTHYTHTHTHTHTYTQTHIHTHTHARVLCLDVAQQSTVESTTQVSDARAAKEADEERLHARLSQLKQELWTVENKTVPEWVSTVDVATGDDVNPLPLHCTVQ
jgi:hypothetical protein